MTTTDRATENDMTPLFRTQIKANGITIWTIASESGIDYHVTVFEGKVSSCEQANGEPCKGFRYHQGKCHHSTLVTQLEERRKQASEDERRTRENNFALSMNF
jgi:hypothetical protein